MRHSSVVAALFLALSLAACSNAPTTPSSGADSGQANAVKETPQGTNVFWTSEEINAVKDLSELGKFHMLGNKVYLGEKQIRPEDTQDKPYSFNTNSQLNSLDGGYMRGTSSSIARVSNCISTPTGWLGTATITGISSTAITSSTKAIFMAVDGKLWRRQYSSDSGIYDQKYNETTYGYPTSGVTVNTTGTENCAAIVTGSVGYIERGWHKAIFPIRDLSGNSTTTVYGTSEG